MINETIEKAIKIVGGQMKLTESCGVSQNSVSLWKRGSGINGKYLKRIEKATNGEVTVEDLAKSFEG